MTTYWSLMGVDCRKIPHRWIANEPDPYVPGLRWHRGVPMDPKIMPHPYTCRLKEMRASDWDDGPYLPECFTTKALLLTHHLYEIMLDEGASNMEAWPAALLEPDGSATYTNYKAINLLGLIAAADLKKSIYTEHQGGPRIDVDFDQLVIDDKKAAGTLIFRLAESSNVILVHDRLKRRLEKEGFVNLWFEKPGDIAT